MVYSREHNCRICLQFVYVIGDRLVELIAISCLDNVVRMINILRWKDTNEIASVADGLYLIERRKRTHHDIGRFEVLPLNKRVQVLIVPMLVWQHRPNAEDS